MANDGRLGRRPRRAGAPAHTPPVTAAPAAQSVPGGTNTTRYWDADFIVGATAPTATYTLVPRRPGTDWAALDTGGVPTLTRDNRSIEAAWMRADIVLQTVSYTRPVGATWLHACWLSDILAEPRSLPGQYVVWLFGRLLSATAVLHADGMCYNRMLPETVIVNQDDHAVLLADWRSALVANRQFAPGPTWSPLVLAGLAPRRAQDCHAGKFFDPAYDVAGLVGILTRMTDLTTGADHFWLNRYLAWLRHASRTGCAITASHVRDWYAAASSVYGPARRHNFTVQMPQAPLFGAS